VDGNGNTVLHHLVEGPVPTQGREARQALRVRWLRRLMEAGANPALTNRYDETALQAAARLGRGPVIDALLAEQPEQLDAPATRDAMVAALLNGNGATAERLQELGVAVNFWAALLLNDRLAAEWALDEEPWLLTAERPPRGIGPVGYAMKGGHVELARWLLEQGADPTAETFGRILFADALKEDAPYDFFELMFDKGYAAAVDRPDGNGRTPLHRAASARRLDLVQLLLRHGADPNARDHRHHTVLSAAGTDEIRAALLAAGADPDG
jgi:ankyrin repeat protein